MDMLFSIPMLQETKEKRLWSAPRNIMSSIKERLEEAVEVARDKMEETVQQVKETLESAKAKVTESASSTMEKTGEANEGTSAKAKATTEMVRRINVSHL